MVTVHSAMKPRGGSWTFSFFFESGEGKSSLLSRSEGTPAEAVLSAVTDFALSTTVHCSGKRGLRCYPVNESA